MTKQKSKKTLSLVVLALIFLFNPNINLIDPLPDIFGYLILIRAIGKWNEVIPYLDESKDLFKKMAIISAVKIPAMIIMLANIVYGRDIIPLFTFVFCVIELVWLLPAIDNASSAIFHIGERTDIKSVISEFKFISVKIRPELLKLFTYIFCIAKAVFSFLPELCLLTVESEKLSYILKKSYIPALLTSISSVLIIGIIWLLMCICYIKKIKLDKCAEGVAEKIASKERLLYIEKKCILNSKMSSLSLLAFSMIFLFDIRFAETNDVNLLPHFLFGILMIFVIERLFINKKIKLLSITSASLFCVISAIGYFLTIAFVDKYDYKDISALPDAKAMYATIEALAIAECMLFVILAFFMFLGLTNFIKENTALSPNSELYSKQDKDYHFGMTVKTAAIFTFASLISIIKCIGVFVESNVVIIFGREDIIESTVAPWLPTLIFGITLLLVFSVFNFISSLKEDIEMKVKEEEL